MTYILIWILSGYLSTVLWLYIWKESWKEFISELGIFGHVLISVCGFLCFIVGFICWLEENDK